MTRDEIEQCRQEWEEVESTESEHSRNYGRAGLYAKWFYPLLLHARTGLAVEAAEPPRVDVNDHSGGMP